MTYRVIKKQGNAGDSSQQDIYIQRGSDAEHPCADRRKVQSFRRLLRRHRFEHNVHNTLKPALDTSDYTNEIQPRNPEHAFRLILSRQTSLAKKGRANRVAADTFDDLDFELLASTSIVFLSCTSASAVSSPTRYDAKPQHPPNQQQHDHHLIFVP